ncbi:unnamed protein product [Soboliphyme baturini]|uniref:ERAP1_C domain-containing protein n=1 Tax=Soboliphyme baturini TaxID=241478 RepID=A0A183IY99_9BILA|nr:unnamed protein product [Soboliphyme baturini]
MVNMKRLSKYKHTTTIQLAQIETTGTRTVVVDANKNVFVFNPVFDTLLEISTSCGNIIDVLWENWSPEKLHELLQKFMSLKSWHKAWKICTVIGSSESWLTLSHAALEHLNLDFAMKVYREMKNVSMVWYLTEIKEYEDRNLLAGCIAIILGQYDMAEKYFLESSSPERALEMRRELLQWEKALQLAKQIAPDMIPFVAKECAQDCEFS